MTELRKTNYDLEIGRGNVPGLSLRSVNGEVLATTTEKVIAVGFTGRYLFPATKGQPTIVSTDVNDASGGTGLTTVLLRGLTEDGSGNWINDTEAAVMDGQTPVAFTKDWIRINNVLAIGVGAGGANAGDVTVSMGGDQLAFMATGDNITRMCVWSTATELRALGRYIGYLGDKVATGSVTFRTYLKQVTPISFPIAKAFVIPVNQQEFPLPLQVPFTIFGGADFEITAQTGAGTTNATAFFELTLEDTS